MFLLSYLFSWFLKSLVSSFPSFQKLFLKLLHVSKYVFELFCWRCLQICRLVHVWPFSLNSTKKISFLCLFLSVFGRSDFLFSFLNFCFSLVSLSCCPFWMYLFFEDSLWFDYPFSAPSLFSPFTYFPVISKNEFFWIVSVFAVSFFERERNGVFLLQFNIFTFLNVCFPSLFPPFSSSSIHLFSFFLSPCFFFRFFRHFNFSFFLLVDCLFVFSIFYLSSKFVESFVNFC